MLTIVKPAGSTKTRIRNSFFGDNNSGLEYSSVGGGRYNTAAATDAFELMLSTGTIDSGDVRLYGVVK